MAPRRQDEQLVSTVIFRRLVDQWAARTGMAGEATIRSFGVDPEVVCDPESWIPACHVESLLVQIGEALGTDSPGLRVGAEITTGDGDLLGYAMQTSANLRQAFRLAARYWGLVGKGVEAYFTAENGGATFVYAAPPNRVRQRRHRDELVIASLVQLGRHITGTTWWPTHVSFQHSAPADLEAHHALFGPCVRFDEQVNELGMDEAVLDLPCTAADESLHGILERYAISLVRSDLEHPPLIQRVRRALLDAMPSRDVTLARISRDLGMSERTLQRRLRELDTSHQELLHQTRQFLAESYLRGRTVSVDEVAFLLGYANTSAFTRAFRKWTGIPPRRFRADASGGSG